MKQYSGLDGIKKWGICLFFAVVIASLVLANQPKTNGSVALFHGHSHTDEVDEDFRDIIPTPQSGSTALTSGAELPANSDVLALLCYYKAYNPEQIHQLSVDRLNLLFEGDPSAEFDHPQRYGARAFMRLVSYGTVVWETITIKDWQPLPISFDEYYREYERDGKVRRYFDYSALMSDCLRAHGYSEENPPEEHRIAFFVPRTPGYSVGGHMYPLMKSAFYRNFSLTWHTSPGIFAHEALHGEGIYHQCVLRFNSDGEPECINYEDRYSPTGAPSNVGVPVVYSQSLGWLPPGSIKVIEQPETPAEVTVELAQLYPGPVVDELPEGSSYGVCIPLNPDEPVMPNIRHQAVMEQVCIEYRDNTATPENEVNPEEPVVNIDAFGYIRRGVSVYITHRWEHDDPEWLPTIWYPRDGGYRHERYPLRPDHPYSVYGGEDLRITFCPQYEAEPNGVMKVRIGFGMECTQAPIPLPTPAPTETPLPSVETVYLPLITR